MQPLPASQSCFVCGQINPLGFKLRFETDGEKIYAPLSFRKEHTGFKEVVHGGLISTVLDEIMVWACGVQTGRFAFCVELNVRFQRQVRPEIVITAVGELTANRKNRLFEASGFLRDSQQNVLASATGIYVPIKERDTADLLAELEWDPRTLKEKAPLPGNGKPQPQL